MRILVDAILRQEPKGLTYSDDGKIYAWWDGGLSEFVLEDEDNGSVQIDWRTALGVNTWHPMDYYSAVTSLELSFEKFTQPEAA